MEKNLTLTEEKTGKNRRAVQHEDVAWKTMMHFFAGEVLPFLGITGKVVGLGPTELVRLEVRKFYEDFTFRMEDGSWKHFEFQSRDNGVADLKRFRAYEAVDSYQNQVDITTYVLYSGKIKNPVTEYYGGVNTYRIVPVIMGNRNADEHLEKLKKKSEAGEMLTREELVLLALSPLMGGESLIKERIKKALEITNEGNVNNTEDKNRIGAVIYVMADKFLDVMEMEEVKEMIRMTKLGQMLVEDGRREGLKDGQILGEQRGMQKGMQKGMRKGMQKGIQKGMHQVVCNMHRNGFSTEDIMKSVDQEREVVLKWLEEVE